MIKRRALSATAGGCAILAGLLFALILVAGGSPASAATSQAAPHCKNWAIHNPASPVDDHLNACVLVSGTAAYGSGHYDGASIVILTVLTYQCSTPQGPCAEIGSNRGTIDRLGTVAVSGVPVAGGHFYKACTSISFGRQSVSNLCSGLWGVPS